MSLTPAYDQREIDRKRDAVEKCGKNMGPHDFIPIEFTRSADGLIERATRLLCRVCFCNIQIRSLLENYPEVKR